MARLSQSNFVQGGYYHVYNRGNNKQDIFKSTKDFNRYLENLKRFKQKHNVTIIAYCLMPNHVHLLLRQNGPDPIPNFMQRTHTAYTMYFNLKHKTTGHVFEGPFKAKNIARDEYLLHLSRYIHLNPLGIVKRLPAYKWSSYPAYTRGHDDKLTETKLILSYFKRRNQTQEDARREYTLFVRSQQKHVIDIKKLTFSH